MVLTRNYSNDIQAVRLTALQNNLNLTAHISDNATIRVRSQSTNKNTLGLYINNPATFFIPIVPNYSVNSFCSAIPSPPTVRINGVEGREEAVNGGEEATATGEEDLEGRRRLRREEEEEGEEEQRDVQDLPIQGPETGASRHRDLEQSDGDHEQFHQRHIREARDGVGAAGALQ